MQFSTYTPLWLLIACAVISGWAWRRSLVDRTPFKRALAHGLRLFGIVCLILALCRPYLRTESDHLHIVHLIDISESVDPDSIRRAADEIETSSKELKSTDRSTVLAFGNGMFATDPQSLRLLATEAMGGTADPVRRNSTALAEALLGSRLVFDAEMARRLVIYSDGVPTTRGLDKALSTLREEDIDVRFRPAGGLKQAEAAIVALEPATTVAFRGEMVRMRLALRANQAMKATARILQRGVAVASTPVELAPDKDVNVHFDVMMTASGESRWEAELLPEKDWFPINNRAGTTITVKGEPRILVLHRDEKQMRPLARAMKNQGLDLEIRGERGLPDSIPELLAFDAVVLADVPATSITRRQMEFLRRYVSDFGGGLAMFGSENSFGLGGYFRTPVEEALPLTSRYEKEKQKPSLAMVLVIDKSGSMSGAPIELARASAKAAAELLGAQDLIAVVGFDSETRVVLPMTGASDKGTILTAIESLTADGGTDAYPGMVEGQRLLQNAVAKVKHMIVLSDGQTPDNDFAGLARAMRSQGITVSGVALGDGAAKEIMQMISQEGGGRYYETNDPNNMPQIFTKETMQASRSAIKEDLFGAAATNEHPILNGYEKSEFPFVLGYVMTQPKPTAQVLLAAETGDPLMAICRYGLGTGLSWTSDLSEKWGGEWLGWSSGPAFWAQILRGIVRKEQSTGLVATGSVADESWDIDITRRDSLDQPVNQVRWEAKAVSGRDVEIPVSVRQTGVGRYRARINLMGHDRIQLRLRDTDFSLMKTLGWQRDYPAEYRLDSKPDPAMAGLARFDAGAPRADIHKAKVYQDISHWFVFLGFAAFIAGIFTRRI